MSDPENNSVLNQMMDDDSMPSDASELLKSTNKVRWGLVKRHLGDTDDAAILAQVGGLLNNIDKQTLTVQRMNQDKEEGSRNREIAQDLMASMLAKGVMVNNSDTPSEEIPIESSGLEILDGELLTGDDTLNSIIKD